MSGELDARRAAQCGLFLMLRGPSLEQRLNFAYVDVSGTLVSQGRR